MEKCVFEKVVWAKMRSLHAWKPFTAEGVLAKDTFQRVATYIFEKAKALAFDEDDYEEIFYFLLDLYIKCF